MHRQQYEGYAWYKHPNTSLKNPKSSKMSPRVIAPFQSVPGFINSLEIFFAKVALRLISRYLKVYVYIASRKIKMKYAIRYLNSYTHSKFPVCIRPLLPTLGLTSDSYKLTWKQSLLKLGLLLIDGPCFKLSLWFKE